MHIRKLQAIPGLEDPANRLPKAVERTAPMAMFLYSLVVIWFHRTGQESVRFPLRPWYPKKAEPSFADMLTTLRRLSYDEKTEGLVANPILLKTWLAQLTELLSRTGRSIRSSGIPGPSRASQSISRGEFHQPGRSRSVLQTAKLELSRCRKAWGEIS
jgi:hypothetical protein